MTMAALREFSLNVRVLTNESPSICWRASRLRSVGGGSLARSRARCGTSRRTGIGQRVPPPRPRRAALGKGSFPAAARARRRGGDRGDRWVGRAHARRRRQRAQSRAAARAARVLARALNRGQRYKEAVDVLDRAAAVLDGHDPALAMELEAGAVITGLNDPATAPAMSSRRAALRDCAERDCAASAGLLGVASFISVLSNEPADVGAELATRALLAKKRKFPGGTISHRSLRRPSRARRSRCCGRSDTPKYVRCSMPPSQRPASTATPVCLRFASRAVAGLLSDEATWARPRAMHTRLLLLPSFRRHRCTAHSTAGCSSRRSSTRAGSRRRSRLSQRSIATRTAASSRPQFCVSPGARLRVATGAIADGLEDFLGVGDTLTRGMVTTPAFLPWRSEAALAHRALGDDDAAERLSAEELELARAFGAPRAIGVASRAAGIVAGGERGEHFLATPPGLRTR